jgi:hypothetical protein
MMGMIEYVSSAKAAEQLGVSPRTVSRAAKSRGIGVFVDGRLVAIDPRDIAKIRPFIHSTPGNPDWIARSRELRRAKKK